tara:strand:+ start:16801 stop:17088 length:288 start_codon:yes stop_codon:yes gene_type:complete
MKKVIYIEKETLLRDMLKLVFSQAGHQFYPYDGSEPMDYYISDIDPDLIICDRDSYSAELPSQIPVLYTSKDEGDYQKPINGRDLLTFVTTKFFS